MSKKWKMSDIKDKGIFIDQNGVGRVLTPPKKITDADIEKAINKAKRKIQRSTQSPEDIQGNGLPL